MTDRRGRLSPCLVCGTDTRADGHICSGCRIYIPENPLIRLVRELQPKHPVPQPAGLVVKQLACEKNPELFFTNNTAQATAAKYMCESCPLKEWCVDFAVKNNEKGIWGGTSGADRRRIRREGKVAA